MESMEKILGLEVTYIMMTTEVIHSLEKETEIKINNFEVIRALELGVFSSMFPNH